MSRFNKLHLWIPAPATLIVILGCCWFNFLLAGFWDKVVTLPTSQLVVRQTRLCDFVVSNSADEFVGKVWYHAERKQWRWSLGSDQDRPIGPVTQSELDAAFFGYVAMRNRQLQSQAELESRTRDDVLRMTR